MPPTASRRSGIPRLGSLRNTHSGDTGNTQHTHTRKPRKSSSSDAENEFTHSTKNAQARVSRPMKVQGPFRPSIVGRIARNPDWMAGRKTTRSISRDNIPTRRPSEERKPAGKKSKSSSPTERRPLKASNIANTLVPKPGLQQQLNKEKEKVKNLEKQMIKLDFNTNIDGLQEENRILQDKVDSFQKEVVSCKKALEKCHIDPVTLEPLNLKNTHHAEKLFTQEEIEDTKKELENILSQNRTMLESLKDLMESV